MNELSDSAYEMLRHAVRAAKDFQIKSIKSLKEFLGSRFPGREDDIDHAIAFWAAYVQAKHTTESIRRLA